MMIHCLKNVLRTVFILEKHESTKLNDVTLDCLFNNELVIKQLIVSFLYVLVELDTTSEQSDL